MVDTVRDIRTRFIGENRMGAAARAARRDVGGIGDEYDKLRRRVAVTNQIIAGVTLGIGGGSAARTLSNLQNQTARLGTLTSTLAKDQAFLSDTSRRLSIDIEAATSSFARFNVLEQSGALREGESEEFLDGLGDAFARFGASASQQENVIYGLAQALGQGNLQAAELNQTVEPLPGLLNDIASQAGLTAGEYRKLVKEGKVLSTTFKDQLLGALRTYDGTAESLSGNIQQTLTRLSNSYKETLLILQQPITDGVGQVAGAITGALEIVGRNTGLTVGALQLVGAAVAINYGAQALRAVSSFTSRMGAATKTQAGYLDDVAQAHQRNAAESVRAQDQLSVARKEQLRLDAREKASADQRVRNSALTANNKAREAAATKTAAQETNKAALAERTLATNKKEAELTTAKQNATTARGAQIVAAANARVAASTNKSKEANLQLAAANRALNASEKAVITNTNQLTAARTKQVAAAARYQKSADATQKSLARQVAARQALTNAERQALSSTLAAGNATTNHKNAVNQLTASQVRAQAAITATSLSMRAQVAASSAAAAGSRAIGSAFAFIGGKAGLATLAIGGVIALTRNFLAQSEVVKTAREELERLEGVYKAVGETADQTKERLSVVNQLQNRLTEIKDFEVRAEVAPETSSFIDTLSAMSQNTIFFQLFNGAKLDREEAQVTKLLSEINTQNDRIKSAENDVTSIQRVAQRFNAVREQQLGLVKTATEYADKFNTAANNIDGLRSRIATINRALKETNLSDDRRSEFTSAIAAAQEELNKATGVTAQLQEQKKIRENILADQSRIAQSLDTELQQIKRTFDTNEIKLNVSLEQANNGVAGFDAGEINGLILRNAEAREKRITEFTTAEEKKRSDAALKIQRNAETEKQKAFTTETNRLKALAEARTSFGDESGAVNARLAIRLREIDATTKLERDARVLKAAAETDATRELEAIKTKIINEEIAKRQANAQKVTQLAGIGNNFLSAAIKDIGSYIQITDSMTDAERARSEESNRVNKKDFERNKRFRAAQAIIDTYAAANAALAQGGLFGIGAAAGIVALGLRNVSNINSQQYGSSSAASSAGFSSSSTGGTSAGGSSSSSSSGNSGANVFILGAPGESSQQTVERYNGILPELAQAAASRQVVINNDQIVLSDAALLG